MTGKIGPGPGAYLLPSTVGYDKHDFTRYRNPQFTMAAKLPYIDKRIGPGPAHDVGRFTKYGKISPPMYSMSSRPRDLTIFKPPGPGTYSPEKAPRMREPRPPAYTMSARHQALKGAMTPAPNQYPQPSTIGPKIPNMPASSAYTMSGKHGLKDLERSPGPARYGETSASLYKTKPPTYTMGIKHVDLTGRSPNPGPAGYLPKLPGPCCKPAGYSFGRRTSIEPFITAADNMPCTRRK
ncbi:shippo-1-related [Holotrichia oblita]|uniref:Shippo-1-related n=3 Tax=Holotrichia oblita TaxID=644536 RepID=A0ACB9TJ73_HOLOL|nr:shippo-1-related [Holotrichia oblita]KAI4466891.1 shippo-1-related [Holotrichia oblita]KAI4466950.1 shippo-1-related [Holotrichia oblita]